jgi:membrane-bound metal-dependent hydrolase YbcI (DUF457 family)
MLLWFVGPSVLIVWAVFRSPTADYRLVAAGALLPLLELPFGGARFLHSVVAPTLAMVAVMVVFRGRRIVQRRLLGLPIGMFLHLVLDAAWADQHAFWWPFLGTAWSPDGLPEINRGWLAVVLEAAGAGACWWAWRRFRLDEPDRRDELLRTGRLGRDIVPGA